MIELVGKVLKWTNVFYCFYFCTLSFIAIDIDEMNNSNSMVNYEILQGNYEALFTVDQYSGKVKVKEETEGEKRLPPSDGSNITLTVRAYDLGIPQLSSTTYIFIYTMVSNSNYNKISINQKCKFRIQQAQ